MPETTPNPARPPFFQEMSSAPPGPTPSLLPPLAKEDTATITKHHGEDKDDHGRPLLRFEIRDIQHEAVKMFFDNVDITTDFKMLVDLVIKLLYYPAYKTSLPTPTVTSPSRSQPHEPSIPQTRSVTLVLEDMDGVAYTKGMDIDNDHKEIHLSLQHVKRANGTPSRLSSTLNSDNKPSSSRSDLASQEILGVLCHELVHCYQWNAKDTCPGGLIEGIADWVRLRAGYIPPHWAREGGKHWDAGYQTTGYFLDWIESRKGEGSVRRLNEALQHAEYNDKMWSTLFGEDVGSLWTNYCEHFNLGQESDGNESGSD